ncbi:MAG: LON peptidase substrate-binding domain-containing protein [Acidimicrobiales bacterium]
MTEGDGADPDGGLKGDTTMPMFPLGSVLFPAMPLPLRVFEPRYVKLLGDCIDGDSRFGVVLIERGSEVGGDDVRTDIGTVARLVTVSTIAPDQYAAVAVGEEIVDVVEWLDDDPYPRAVVRPRAGRSDEIDEARLAAVTAKFRRVLAMHSEMVGGAAPATVELVDRDDVRVYQMAAMAPLGPFDQQRLLAANGSAARLDLVATMLDEVEELLRAGFAADTEPGPEIEEE